MKLVTVIERNNTYIGITDDGTIIRVNDPKEFKDKLQEKIQVKDFQSRKELERAVKGKKYAIIEGTEEELKKFNLKQSKSIHNIQVYAKR